MRSLDDQTVESLVPRHVRHYVPLAVGAPEGEGQCPEYGPRLPRAVAGPTGDRAPTRLAQRATGRRRALFVTRRWS